MTAEGMLMDTITTGRVGFDGRKASGTDTDSI